MKLASHTMMPMGSGICARRQDARAGLLMDDHARVVAQLPGELVGAAVDRIDARRAALEQHIGEAAGRTADIHGDEAGHVDAEMVEAHDRA